MILATTDITKIKSSEINKLYAVYGNMGKKIEQKIVQSLCARYFCHIICQNNIKCNVNNVVYLDNFESLKNICHLVKKYDDGTIYYDDKNFFISLSHSDVGALAAVSTSKIGADIQKVKKYNQKISKRYFSADEIKYINNSKNMDETFSLVWSFKESLFKSGYVSQKDFWQNSSKDQYSLFDENGQKEKLNLSPEPEISHTNVWIVTKICEDFVITGICNKKESILLAI